jgi:galactonate dehydratase
MMYRDSYWRTGAVLMSAMSAVEMAMWDITGKSLGVPVSHLLGGPVRDSIRMYANAWFAGAKAPEEFAAKAKEAVGKGMTALKWDPFGKAYLTLTNGEFGAMLDCVAAVREAVGPETDLLIEGHGRFNISTAIRVARALEPYRPMFFEEPVPPDSLDALCEVRDKSPIPIAAGERVYSHYAMREFLEKRCADFVQPDVSHSGGILAMKKMAAMVEDHYLCFAPHNPSGPVANAASLQLAGNLNNFFILEIMLTDVSWRSELTDEEVVFDKGSILIPQKPGLGLDINEEACLRHPYQPVQLRHYNGNLTDIRPAGVHTTYYFKGI